MATEYNRIRPENQPGGSASLAGLSPQELLARIVHSRKTRPVEGAVRTLLEAGSLNDLVAERESRVLDTKLSAAQSLRLAAALELAHRVARDRDPGGFVVRGPGDVAALTSNLLAESKEHFVAHYLNTRNALLGRETISIGSLNASIVHPREVFEPAVRRKACAVVVAHNHPSGNPEPSEDDIRITRRLQEAGEILGIQLLDHVIVGIHGFRSLEEEGYMRS